MIHERSVTLPPAGHQQAHQHTTSAPDTLRQLRTRRPGQWCWLDTAIVATYGPRIGAYGVAVYAVLAAHANGRTQACWPSINRIASELQLSRSTVKRTLRTLRNEGLIAIDPREDPAGDATSNSYTLLDPTPEPVASLAAVPQGGRVSHDPPPVPKAPTGRVSGAPKPEEPQQEERTSKASEFRVAKDKEEAKDEPPRWDAPPVSLPSSPSDRPDEHLQHLPIDEDALECLRTTAIARLVAKGTKRDLLIKPVIETEMLVVYAEDLSPRTVNVAA